MVSLFNDPQPVARTPRPRTLLGSPGLWVTEAVLRQFAKFPEHVFKTRWNHHREQTPSTRACAQHVRCLGRDEQVRRGSRRDDWSPTSNVNSPFKM